MIKEKIDRINAVIIKILLHFSLLQHTATAAGAPLRKGSRLLF